MGFFISVIYNFALNKSISKIVEFGFLKFQKFTVMLAEAVAFHIEIKVTISFQKPSF